MNITKPTSKEIQETLIRWESMENYVLQESSLRKLFTITYPKNESLDDVLIKVCSLNDFYSTNIFSPFTVAKHIVAQSIDDKIQNGDLSIVNKIAKITMPGDKVKNFYSFASKYCSHHNPNSYPIYDSFAEKILLHFNKKDSFFKFKKQDLKDYSSYFNIILSFKKHYDLNDFDLKQIDKYLWIKGKDHFPKNYSNSKATAHNSR